MTIDPLRLLASILEGEAPTISDVNELMEVAEGQHLDFKDGKITCKARRKEGKPELQEAVNAFGNSDGGLLVVGVTDKRPRKVSPCESLIGSEQLDKWAENLIAGMVSPLPRIHVVAHEEGPVLLLAVPRAPRLVPIARAGKLAYFLRLNQSTLEAPPYLLSDLILGRRQQPYLRLKKERVTCTTYLQGGAGIFTFQFEVENDGLNRVDNLLVGVVSWTSTSDRELNSHLRTYVEMVEPSNNSDGHQLYPGHFKGKFSSQIQSPVVLNPFASIQFSAPGCKLPLPRAKITAAVYLLPTGSEPIWYEVEFKPPATVHGKAEYEVEGVVLQGPITNRRPRVSWEKI